MVVGVSATDVVEEVVSAAPSPVAGEASEGAVVNCVCVSTCVSLNSALKIVSSEANGIMC